MVMEDKGMRQRNWGLCEYGGACLCVLYRPYVSHWGWVTGEGIKSSGESVIGREMGLRDYELEVE